MREWKIVKVTSDGQEYVESRELKSGPRSSCRAVFFRNTHKTSGKKIVSLQVARYGKSAGEYKLKKDKAITLSDEELDELIDYIQDYYTPLNVGMREFIAADEDAAKLFKKVNDLGISDDEVVSKLAESGILTENLFVAITAAKRNEAINDFEKFIDMETRESFWQEWFAKNKWILGTEYLNILPEREIDTNDIADYLVRSIDGFLDIVEIKKPSLQFWTKPDSHGNLCPTASLTAAITQCLNYLYRIELQSNSVDFLQRVDQTKTIKPQCLLVYGRSNEWTEKEYKALRILNSAYHQLHVITYDQLLLRAKQLLGIEDVDDTEDFDLTDIPF